jgi:hypothetical protein
MSQQDVLSPDTVAMVQKADPQLLSPESDGQRRVSWDLLSPSTGTPRSSSGSDPSTWTSRETSESPTTRRSLRVNKTRTVSIPTRLDSIQAYHFMGFTKEVSAKLLANQRKSESPYDTAKYWVTSQCIGVGDVTADWDTAMQRIGIKDEVRLPMLKSEHQMILSMQPLSVWLIEIIDTFWDCLQDMEANIVARLSEPVAHLRGGGGDEGGGDEESEYSVPQTPGGHLAVFKSVDGRRLKKSIRPNGTFDLSELASGPMTDFCKNGGLYFTHQIWVAKAYSKLISDACSVADRRTIELHVPLSHFEEIKVWKLPYGDEWKQVVWHSRRGEHIPKNLRSIRGKHGCIQGPISHSYTGTIANLNHWEKVAWKHVMTNEVQEDGKTQILVATQYVWWNENGYADLEEAVHQKVYVRLPEKGFREVREPWKDLQHLK